MALTGIEKLYWAESVLDDTEGATFDLPVYLPGVKSLDFEPKYDASKLYAEDKLWNQATSFTEATAKINLADLTNTQLAKMTGGKVAAEGGAYFTDNPNAPYGALLYKAPKDNGEFRYGVFYKGKFTPPKRNTKGKEGKTDFQTPELEGLFQGLKYNGMTEYHVDTDDADCPVNIEATWFTGVVIPTEKGVVIVVPTVTSVPLDAATSVDASANVLFTFSTEIRSSTVNDSSVFLMKADGSAVTATLSVDVTHKIVTLDPTDSMGSGAYVAVCTKNVKSLAGVAMAANKVVNFTV